MGYRRHFHRIVFGAIVCLAAASVTAAQDQQGQQTKQSQQGQQTNPPQQTQKPSLKNPEQNAAPAPAVDPKEEAAFKAFYDINPTTPADLDAQITAGEQFVKDYPQSHYRAAVYSRLANVYLQKNDYDKMCDAADKDLALNPDDITVLIPIGNAIPHASPASPNFAEHLVKAEQYEKHALDVLSTLPKPANLTDEQFKAAKDAAVAEAHGALGLVYYWEKKVDESAAELQKATDGVTDPDPTNYFVLGKDLEQLQKYPDAVKAFDSCSQITSPLQDRCKQGSAEAKAKEGSAPKP